MKKIKNILKKFYKNLLNYKNIKHFEQQFPNIKFDKQYYDCFLSKMDIYNCKLERIKLKNLKCRILKENGKWEKLPLNQSPDYCYLQTGDKEPYIKYHSLVDKTLDNCSHSCEKFEQLIKTLEESGYDDNYPICVKKNNVIMDGQHRASYLMNKYGEDYEITVLKIYY